ncbi:MAG: type II toxin-antitoxin system VapC family toxin [Candidatus Lokiarchaeota archaeon]|nr:type II toxin-antitoxin system VapC family toxin [Candidatus Lokiarchaeota archaeon]
MPRHPYPLAVLDTFIAAIVLQHGKTIVTGNPEHFKRVPGLHVVEYA